MRSLQRKLAAKQLEFGEYVGSLNTWHTDRTHDDMDGSNVSGRSSSSLPRPVLEISLEISKSPHQRNEVINVMRDSVPEEIVESFMQRFDLKPFAFNPILSVVLEQMKDIQQQRVVFTQLRGDEYYKQLMHRQQELCEEYQLARIQLKEEKQRGKALVTACMSQLIEKPKDHNQQQQQHLMSYSMSTPTLNQPQQQQEEEEEEGMASFEIAAAPVAYPADNQEGGLRLFYGHLVEHQLPLSPPLCSPPPVEERRRWGEVNSKETTQKVSRTVPKAASFTTGIQHKKAPPVPKRKVSEQENVTAVKRPSPIRVASPINSGLRKISSEENNSNEERRRKLWERQTPITNAIARIPQTLTPRRNSPSPLKYPNEESYAEKHAKIKNRNEVSPNETKKLSERLAQQRNPTRCARSGDTRADQENDRECTFHPQINQKSRELSKVYHQKQQQQYLRKKGRMDTFLDG